MGYTCHLDFFDATLFIIVVDIYSHLFLQCFQQVKPCSNGVDDTAPLDLQFLLHFQFLPSSYTFVSSRAVQDICDHTKLQRGDPGVPIGNGGLWVRIPQHHPPPTGSIHRRPTDLLQG